MTNRLIIIFLIILYSCNTRTKEVFELPSTKDIDTIISIIIKQERLDLIKYYRPDAKDSTELNGLLSKKIGIPISVDLTSLNIFNDWKTNDTNRVPPPPPGFASINLSELMNREVNGNKIFNISDTSFILYQNQNLKKYEITFLDSTVFRLTTLQAEEKKRMMNKHVSYYDFSIPIFSADKSIVYVELTNNCTGLCGGASYYILKKLNGSWVIIDNRSLWIS